MQSFNFSVSDSTRAAVHAPVYHRRGCIITAGLLIYFLFQLCVVMMMIMMKICGASFRPHRQIMIIEGHL